MGEIRWLAQFTASECYFGSGFLEFQKMLLHAGRRRVMILKHQWLFHSSMQNKSPFRLSFAIITYLNSGNAYLVSNLALFPV